MPNGLAYLMLLIWPIASLAMFRKMSVERALVWTLLGGYLLLPPLAEYNLPLVPAMDKTSIPNLCALLIIVGVLGYRRMLWPRSRIAQVLLVGLLVSTVPTVLTNRDPMIFQVLENADPIVFMTDFLPGLSIRDIGSVFIAQVLTIVPFLLARRFLATEKGLRELLLAFMVGGLIYTVPSLIEIRLSPQINVWTYGFFQHSFAQTIRAGGYRPIVFLPHGLWLAFFMLTAVLSAAALARAAEAEKRVKLALVLGYLFFVLVLCKSLASLLYGLALTPLVLFVPVRWQLRVALFFAFVAVAYPMLRNFGVIPLEAIVAQAEAVSADRAQSLDYRFNNEQLLLGRAAEKPVFGWGGWGRNLIRHPETAQIISVPDGRWIIVFGSAGWVGYICEFGLLALPIVLIWREVRRRNPAAVSPFIAPVTLILAITMIDMLLNATLTPLTWLCAGAVLGHAETLRLGEQRPVPPRHALRSLPVMARRGTLPQADKRRTVL